MYLIKLKNCICVHSSVFTFIRIEIVYVNETIIYDSEKSIKLLDMEGFEKMMAEPAIYVL